MLQNFSPKTVWFVLIFAIAASAQTPKAVILHNFGVTASDGVSPTGSLVSDSLGNLYGVTLVGGDSNGVCDSNGGCGTVFELVAPASQGGAWQEQILYKFKGAANGGADGAYPIGNLAMDQQGSLYGVAYRGGDTLNPTCIDGGQLIGCGVVYELSQLNGAWTETILHTFEASDGWQPLTPLVFDAEGNLFGATAQGGSNTGGTIFELSPSNGAWTFAVVYNFSNPNQVGVFSPYALMAIDSLGNLYGQAITAMSGNAAIFQIEAGTGQENTIYSFTYPDGPIGGVVVDDAGNLYGTSSGGGSSSIFELSLVAGVYNYTALYNFTQGRGPNDPPMLSSGNFYGTGTGGGGGGIVWGLVKNAYEELDFPKSKCGAKEPCGPEGPPIFGAFGGLYFVSSGGGSGKKCGRESKYGCGTVFAIYIP
jgi:uncharacterized repeat protein (TIGR03803 family)